jgi:sugar phosphate isomerase/epimerase
LKDHIGTQSVAIGAGEIDIAGMIQELHKHDYEGALALKIELKDHDNLPSYVAESYPYLSKIVEQVTDRKPV